MNKGLKKKNCNKCRIIRSGIRGNLKVFLCLFFAAFLSGSCVMLPSAGLPAVQIIPEEDETSPDDELTVLGASPDDTVESDDFHDQDLLQETREYDDFKEFADEVYESHDLFENDDVFENVIEETTEEDEETDASEVMAQTDDPMYDEGKSELFADEEGLITDPDLEAGPAETDLSGMDGEDFIDGEMITITIDDPIVANPDQASGFSGNGKRLLRASGGSGEFTSFYDQLEEPARTFYLLRKSYFADERQTGTLVQEFSSSASEAETSQLPVSPCSFLCDIVLPKDENGNRTKGWTYDNTCDRFKAGYEDVLYYVRASFDAFYYDHPEVFWTRSTSLSFLFRAYNKNEEEQTATVYLAKITLKPVAAYENAASQVAAFDQAVSETAAQISTSSDYDGDGTVSRPELLQGIHDFLCLRCYYDNDGLNTYKTTGDYSIFTAGPVFLKTRAGVVCEGYSRAFKILCDQLGFDCAIVSGKAHTYSTIGHAWNAVHLDGNWYMIDPTWDDEGETQEEIKYQYYLCALNTPNYGPNQLSDRAVNGKIGGNDTTSTTSAGLQVTTRKKVFEFPVYWSGNHSFVQTGIDAEPGEEDQEGIPACINLYSCSEDGHLSVQYHEVGHDWDEGQIVTAATCEGTGTIHYTCKNNPNHTKTAIVPAAGHDWTDGVITSEATCSEPGSIRYICSNDPSHIRDEAIPIDQEAHDWDEGLTLTEPTCSGTGIRIYICRRNGTHTKTQSIPPDPNAHTWVKSEITKPASCTETGIGTFTCIYNASHVKQEGIPIDPEAHDWGEWKTVKEASVDENGVQIRVCRNRDSHMEVRLSPLLGPDAYTTAEDEIIISAPSRPIWRSVKSKGSGKILAKWKKAKGASGYELQVSTGKKFKKKNTMTFTLKKSRYYKNITKLKKGKKYYFRIRAFRLVENLRMNSPWSRVRSAKAG